MGCPFAFNDELYPVRGTDHAQGFQFSRAFLQRSPPRPDGAFVPPRLIVQDAGAGLQGFSQFGHG